MGMLVFVIVSLALVDFYNELGGAYGQSYSNDDLVGNLTALEQNATGTIEDLSQKVTNRGLLGGVATIFTSGSVALFNTLFGFIPGVQGFFAYLQNAFGVPDWIPKIIGLGLLIWVTLLLASAILKWRMQSD